MHKSALLALADGTIFHGVSIGTSGIATGELVFNTAMSGYQEILSDPSYCQQIVTLTYPHVGNVGVNAQDQESNKQYLSGLVIKNLPVAMSNFRAETTLNAYLLQHGIVAIADIDTRKLTQIIRESGAQNACIMADDIDVDQAIALARKTISLKGLDLAQKVTTEETYVWSEGSVDLAGVQQRKLPSKFHVVVYDFGVKHNILRLLVDNGCRLTVVPATTSADVVLALNPDGVFLSNGPGDPQACSYAIAATQELLNKNMPIFGICLGHQILALAAGAKTIKMKFGHHGANHPVINLANKKVCITSQNHGFTLDEQLPTSLCVTHRSLFDDSIQGIQLKDKPAFGFQGHPEASPGPQDLTELFETFIETLAAN
ncbi:MAG: carbamoyl-phosphate synthase small subunit [Legionellales bacterium]|nr:carbamoyl-phosphate synthase small subunit [Legionellales bacterium]